jgi:hypothetical protein
MKMRGRAKGLDRLVFQAKAVMIFAGVQSNRLRRRLMNSGLHNTVS